MEIRFDNFGSKGSDEMLGKGHVLLEWAGQLAWATKAVEESVEGVIGPLLRLPPFRTLPFRFVLRQSFRRNLEVDNRKEEAAPGHDGLGGLLVLREMVYERRLVNFEDQVQQVRDFGRLVREGHRR